MKTSKVLATTALGAAIAALAGSGVVANATEPCGDFGECKALVEINASDGDIGFHFLMDGDSLIYGSLFNPKHRKIFVYWPRRELRQQTSTELFQESAEPLCYDPTTDDDEDNDDEEFVTLAEFIDRWDDGTYYFFGLNSDWEWQRGETELTFDLPAAPAELEFPSALTSAAYAACVRESPACPKPFRFSAPSVAFWNTPVSIVLKTAAILNFSSVPPTGCSAI